MMGFTQMEPTYTLSLIRLRESSQLQTRKTIGLDQQKTMESGLFKERNIGSLKRGVGGVSYGQNESIVRSDARACCRNVT